MEINRKIQGKDKQNRQSLSQLGKRKKRPIKLEMKKWVLQQIPLKSRGSLV
jgi:hypothetical protein